MARISFKDVGTQGLDNEIQSVNEKPRIPIGIKTPLELDESDSDAIFKMHFNLADQITDIIQYSLEIARSHFYSQIVSCFIIVNTV